MNNDLNFELTILPSAPCRPPSRETVKRVIRKLAKSAHAQYPQYDGHWDGPEWVLVKVTRIVKTKMGVAFTKGEVALGRRNDPVTDASLSPATLAELNKPGWTVYSVRNRINTAVAAKAVKELS